MEKLLKFFQIDFFIFLFILIISFSLRFFKLGTIVSSMNRDEAAIGYNAYSILKTGKDEWQEKFPFYFKSFGDYKAPFYIYLTILPIAVFGLNEFSVRFCSAASGVGLVITAYLLVRELLKKKKNKTIFALSTAFLTAIAPWQIFFSRFSYEANLALFLNSLLLLFLIKKNFLSFDLKICILFFLTFFAYSSSLIIWPLFFLFWFLFLFITNIRIYKQRKKEGHLFLIKFIFLLMLLFFAFNKQSAINKQKKGVTIFGDPHLKFELNRAIILAKQNNSFWQKLKTKKYFFYGFYLANNYFKNFSYNFLFGGGGPHPWHKTPNFPHFPPFYLFLFIIGFLFFLKSNSIKRNIRFFYLIFFLLTPAASAITIDAPHATRSLNLFFLIVIFCGLGLGFIIQKLKLWSILVFLPVFFSFFQFLKAYFWDYPFHPPLGFLPGIKEVNLILNKLEDKPQKIVFGNNDDGAYIYLLFYNQYPPQKFFSQVKRYPADSAGLVWVEKFDSYLFIKNPLSDNQFKEVYVLKGNESLNQKRIAQISNPKTNEVYFQIEANY